MNPPAQSTPIVPRPKYGAAYRWAMGIGLALLIGAGVTRSYMRQIRREHRDREAAMQRLLGTPEHAAMEYDYGSQRIRLIQLEKCLWITGTLTMAIVATVAAWRETNYQWEVHENIDLIGRHEGR